MIFDRKWLLNSYNHPFGICLNQARLIGRIRAVGGCMRVGETVENTLTGGGTENRGGETKVFKRGQPGSRGECLKKGGGWYQLWDWYYIERRNVFDKYHINMCLWQSWVFVKILLHMKKRKNEQKQQL